MDKVVKSFIAIHECNFWQALIRNVLVDAWFILGNRIFNYIENLKAVRYSALLQEKLGFDLMKLPNLYLDVCQSLQILR
jgi:hypothetical protein